MSDLSSLMEADTKEKVASPLGNFDDSNLQGVAKLAQQIAAQEETVATLEANLKKAKKELYRLSDEELPSLLAEMGVSSFKLADGSSVNIKKTYGASIPVENREEAYKWLRDHGYGDMVKNIVSVNFGMGEDDKAREIKEQLEQSGLSPDQAESVHPSTLRAWVKEQTEDGNAFPMELFGAYIGQRAIIKGAK
jgi:16S rRNA C1402 N4-methylase RsmH